MNSVWVIESGLCEIQYTFSLDIVSRSFIKCHTVVLTFCKKQIRRNKKSYHLYDYTFPASTMCEDHQRLIFF